jgi:arylsulfatase A
MNTRRQFTAQLSLGGLFGISALSVSGKGPAAPNFLFILSDDHGWSQLSENLDPLVKEAASSYLETPNLDRLGRGGIRFTSGYSPAPICTPTRRAILCGTTAARSGSEFASAWVPADHMTIPKALKQANPAYRCAYFGKWGEKMISTPEESGYDVSDGETGNITGGTEEIDQIVHIVEDPKRTGTLSDRARQFMQATVKAGNPFYLQVSYYAVHLRVEALEASVNKYEQKGIPDRAYTTAWAGMLGELDTGVGRVLDTLDELGIADNTYVVFMSDNGANRKIPGWDETRKPTNYPLTGGKQTLYEGGVRVPFMARGPGIPPGSVCRTPVAGYDLLPTFYDLAGGRAPLPAEVDGISIRPVLTDPVLTDPVKGKLDRRHNALFFHRPDKGYSAIRQGEYKLMLFWNKDGSIKSRELYKVDPDPREENYNIAAAQPEKVALLEKILLDQLKSVNAETPDRKK